MKSIDLKKKKVTVSWVNSSQFEVMNLQQEEGK